MPCNRDFRRLACSNCFVSPAYWPISPSPLSAPPILLPPPPHRSITKSSAPSSISPPRNWTNDPNGLVFYKGEYHLFFQHNPNGIDWGNMTWGHAVSPDLVHWKQLANAIEPDRLGTIFSGSAVVDWDNTAGFQKGDEKTIVAIYTAAGGTSDQSKGQPFTQCIAYSNDRGRTWTKYDKNPVLKHIVGGNRDPKVVWHAPTRRWIMALFLDGNEFAFFSSPDLKTWTQLQRMTIPNCAECPDFFEMPVDGKPELKKWVWTAANGNTWSARSTARHSPKRPARSASTSAPTTTPSRPTATSPPPTAGGSRSPG